jgi:hypothetical protein
MRLLNGCTQHRRKNDRDAGTCPDGAPLQGNLPNPKFEAARSS